MQDIAAIEKSLHGIAAAFKDGGIFFLIGVGLFLAYKVAIILAKRQRKATQEVNVILPGTKEVVPNGSKKVCNLHSGVEAQLESLEEFRKENREDHRQLFDAIGSLKKV